MVKSKKHCASGARPKKMRKDGRSHKTACNTDGKRPKSTGGKRAASKPRG